jgi:hypothetical protein
MTTEEFTLLRKAAADPKGQIALKRDPDGAWPSDRTSFQTLSDRGHVLALGESMGPHIGGTFAVWRITPQGRAVIGARQRVRVNGAVAGGVERDIGYPIRRTCGAA